MFINRYDKKVDNKGRFVIPSEMREESGSVLYMMKGHEGSLELFTEQEFIKLADEVNSLSYDRKDVRLYLRRKLSSTCKLEIDSLGRIQIPSALLTRYNISKEVTIIGVGNHIEIWNRETYEQYDSYADELFDEVSERLHTEETK